MLTVLIADDENKVSLLIKSLIKWEELELTLLGILDNGKDAFDFIKDKKPDIVITDIRMPKMDGLELISASKAIWPDIKFILISGYKQFEYAHSAIKYGVEDYLLKPISEEELNISLMRICDEINVSKSKLDFEKKSTRDIEKSRTILDSTLIEQIILKQPSDLVEFNNENRLSFIEQGYQVLSIRIDTIDPFNIEVKQDRLIVETIIRKCLTEFSPFVEEQIFGIVGKRLIIGILNFKHDSSTDIIEIINNLIIPLGDYIGSYEGYTITIGSSSQNQGFSLLNDLIFQSMKCIESRIFCGTNKKIAWQDLNYMSEPSPDKSDSVETELQLAVVSYDDQKLKIVIQKVFDRIGITSRIDPTVYFRTAFGFIEKTYNFLPDKMSINLQNEKDDFKEFIKSAYSLDILIKNLKNGLAKCLNEARIRQENSDNKPIRDAKKYIENHIAEKITLEDISEIVQLNPVYFSVLFKKETGNNFSAYLVTVRMEVAKTLLRTTNLTIEAIADKVGYKDTKHFSQLFAKIVGVKPAQYRKLYA